MRYLHLFICYDGTHINRFCQPFSGQPSAIQSGCNLKNHHHYPQDRQRGPSDHFPDQETFTLSDHVPTTEPLLVQKENSPGLSWRVFDPRMVC